MSSVAVKPLRIVLAASEAVPFFKTGGLADVAGALTKALADCGHEVTLIIPDYTPLRQNKAGLPAVHDTGLQFTIDMNGRRVTGEVSWARYPQSTATVLLVRQAAYFDRGQPYGDAGGGYADNSERFCFFSRAVPEICRLMVLRPDVLHCNDWQTGLIPALLNSRYAQIAGFEQTASVMTIHNMAYQGAFWKMDMLLTGMHWGFYNPSHMEAWGSLNLLKTGLAFADQLTTVSPTYAREICTPEGGCGLDGLLRWRQSALTGILNGIDIDVWNPATDPLLPAPFSADNWQTGKARCKAHLQQRLGLASSPRTPLIGMVSRLVDQKGLDLIAGCASALLHRRVQLAFLGTGDARYESLLRDLAKRHPEQVSAVIGFDESLAHQIEAGADLFLMPSQFEPCGLNQMYSQRYGTIPIVRQVGGLADSVSHYDGTPAALETATGFVFADYSMAGFSTAVEQALSAWQDAAVWNRLVRNGMHRDWSWQQSADRYVAVYHEALAKVASRKAENRL
jgi:starch synthase